MVLNIKNNYQNQKLTLDPQSHHVSILLVVVFYNCMGRNSKRFFESW